MKKIIASFLLSLLTATAAVAETSYDDINWLNYAATSINDILTTDESNPTIVYFYDIANKKFLTNGGNAGMQGILSNIGMRFYITKYTSNRRTYYRIHSRMDNTDHSGCGDLIGFAWNDSPFYLDRSNNGLGVNHTINFSSKVCTMYSNASKYWYYDGTNLKGSSSSATKWYIITEENYREAINSIDVSQYVDVSDWILDSHFDRNSKDAEAWVFNINGTEQADIESSGDGSYIYSPYHYSYTASSKEEDPYGAYITTRLGNEGNVKVSQTIKNLRTGQYRVTCQGFYNGDDANANSYLYAKIGDHEVKVLLPNASSADATTLAQYNTTTTTSDGINRAIKAGHIFAGSTESTIDENDGLLHYDGTNESTYFVELTIVVTNTNGDGTGNLEIGAMKTSSDGEVYLDNFRLFYISTSPKLYISANNSDPDKVDNTEYTRLQNSYLRRSFSLGKWEPLCLPYNLSNSQVMQAFGNDVQLSELQGIKGTRIVFTKVDLGVSNAAALKANTCYVIKTNKEPNIALGSYTEEFTRGITPTITNSKYQGPIYVVPVASQDAYTDKAPSSTTQADGYEPIGYQCYYYKQSAAAGDYIVSSGTMYKLTSAYTALATTWRLFLTDSEAKLNAIDGMDINSDNSTTSILNTSTPQQFNTTDHTVYNLQGIAVGKASNIDSLPKGVYIVGGKKAVKR